MPFIEPRGGYKRRTRRAALQAGRMLLAYPMDRDSNVRPGVQVTASRSRAKATPTQPICALTSA
jgi:hypothetical protein